METIYKCSKCGKNIPENKIVMKKLPPNFTVTPFSNNNNPIPTCPYCNHLHFFGFEKLQP